MSPLFYRGMTGAPVLLPDRDAIAAYVPHSGEMLLIDRVLSRDEESIVSEVDVTPRLPGANDAGVPAYIGIELMAQTVGAWSGLRRAMPDTPAPIGYLLGSRRYRATIAMFPLGSTLRIGATRVLETQGLGKFDCVIHLLGAHAEPGEVARGGISVYSEPEADLEAVEFPA